MPVKHIKPAEPEMVGNEARAEAIAKRLLAMPPQPRKSGKPAKRKGAAKDRR